MSVLPRPVTAAAGGGRHPVADVAHLRVVVVVPRRVAAAHGRREMPRGRRLAHSSPGKGPLSRWREIRIVGGGGGRGGGGPRGVMQDGGDPPRLHAVALRHLIGLGSVNGDSSGVSGWNA